MKTSKTLTIENLTGNDFGMQGLAQFQILLKGA